jgi:hypothetical protein
MERRVERGGLVARTPEPTSLVEELRREPEGCLKALVGEIV